MKTRIKVFDGKRIVYALCPKCQVWIPKKRLKRGSHKNCEEYQKTLKVRQKAERMALGKFRKR